MPQLREALLVYEGLPASSGGAHRLREPRPTVAWDQMRTFLDHCCDDVVFRQLDLALLDDLRDAARVSELVQSASGLFGSEQRRGLVHGVDHVDLVWWSLSVDQMESALAWVESQTPLSVSTLGPALGVDFEVTFFLKDPVTGLRLPFQEPEYYGNQTFAETPLGTSWMNVRLSAQSTCAIDLFLPFTDFDDEAVSYANSIYAHLPFKLSSKHWRRMQLNRVGAHYYGRKIAGP